jgi:hypothetical protein
MKATEQSIPGVGFVVLAVKQSRVSNPDFSCLVA